MKVYIGIDWSEQKHAVCFMNAAGSVIQELEIAHTPEGFLRLEQVRRDLGVAVADASLGLETAHNLLMDFLVEQGYPQLYVLPPSLVKSNQGRYASSGAKDDRRDARLIAISCALTRSACRFGSRIPPSPAKCAPRSA